MREFFLPVFTILFFILDVIRGRSFLKAFFTRGPLKSTGVASPPSSSTHTVHSSTFPPKPRWNSDRVARVHTIYARCQIEIWDSRPVWLMVLYALLGQRHKVLSRQGIAGAEHPSEACCQREAELGTNPVLRLWLRVRLVSDFPVVFFPVGRARVSVWIYKVARA